MASNGNPHTAREANGSNSVIRGGFKISTTKLPILKAGPIEEMNAKLGITVPEMIFGNNSVLIQHPATGWSLDFNTFDALDRVDKTGENMLQVAHSKEWQSTRYDISPNDIWLPRGLIGNPRQNQHENIKRVIKPFDWSYSTDYKGTLSDAGFEMKSSDKSIPLELLKRPDPILFFDDVVLYEDEMADNGITTFSCKIRVMPERLLLLARFFMRLDGVLFRLRDTRVYVEFASGEVIRENVTKEEQYETVREVS